MTSKHEALQRLYKSKFRSSFHLDEKDIAYIYSHGLDTIQRHAYDFVNVKLKPAYPKNDTKQTPMKGHPVFKAMHGCAMCCRSCLEKWYKVPQGIELTNSDVDKIVGMLMYWMKEEISRFKDNNK